MADHHDVRPVARLHSSAVGGRVDLLFHLLHKPVEYIVGGTTESGSFWPEQNPSIVRPFKEFRAF